MTDIPKTSGIYVITCTANGRIYIGSTVNFRHRWSEHRRYLKGGYHKNALLQAAWNKYGQDAFAFEVLEYCGCDALLEREQYYFDTLKPFKPRGFNISVSASHPTIGRPLSTEHKAKLSVALKGRKMPPHVRAKLSAVNTGRPVSPKTRAAFEAANANRVFSPEHRAKISAAGIGRKRSPEGQARVENAHKKAFIVTAPDGTQTRIFGLVQFCREHGLQHSAMSDIANGKRIHHHGWKCEYAELAERPPAKVRMLRGKAYIVTAPDGTQTRIFGLAQFCREHGLTRQDMSHVANGKLPHHKGWRCEHAHD
jgi:group I intron endonuclease